MWIPREISITAEKLKQGGWVRRITVRQLLRMFKAERRGLNKVQEIRATLEYLVLQTDPDFESAWVDSLIHIRMKPDANGGPPLSAVVQETEDIEVETDEEEEP